MGSRMIPVECEHGIVIDWGDFGPDPDDGQAGVKPCPTCRRELGRHVLGSEMRPEFAAYLEASEDLGQDS